MSKVIEALNQRIDFTYDKRRDLTREIKHLNERLLEAKEERRKLGEEIGEYEEAIEKLS